MDSKRQWMILKNSCEYKLRKVALLMGAGTLLLAGLAGSILADGEELGNRGWMVEQRVGRLFYVIHGTAVWGHEFGFFKQADDCDEDTIWLTFSSSEEKVKDFIGKDIVISLNVDGQETKIKLVMLSVGTLGFTNIMTFTNWSPGEQLIGSLVKGHQVKVRILEPKSLEALLDIKEDRFSLEGFVASRGRAEAICRAS